MCIDSSQNATFKCRSRKNIQSNEFSENKLRNKKNTDTVNAILHIRYGLKRIGKTCSKYEFPDDVLDSVTRNTKYLSGMVSPDKPSTSSGYVMQDEDARHDIFIEDL